MSMFRSALLIVEPDFLHRHVGVRRVILYYWRRLLERGFAVHLATPVDGDLFLGEAPAFGRIEALIDDKHSDAPLWKSRGGVSKPLRHLGQRKPAVSVRWTTRLADAKDYAVSVVTNPWLCALGLPDEPFSAGIVYDMVPNLLACGALDLGTVGDIYGFAHDHDCGYRSYLRNARQIHCISDSSRSDFAAFYGLRTPDLNRLSTIVPFQVTQNVRVRWRESRLRERPRILLVNVLDPRKNFRTVLDVVAQVSKAGYRFDVDLVGSERMAMSRVRQFLDGLASCAETVNWFRSASDACLARLYADADVLLFPSLYEGLGLPILEAQTHGTPVVSSNTSSGAEVNLNPQFSLPPLDSHGLAGAVMSILDRRRGHLQGEPLKAAIQKFLANQNDLPSDWQPQY